MKMRRGFKKTFGLYPFLPGELLRLTVYHPLDAIIIRNIVRKLASSLGYGLFDQMCIATTVFEVAYEITVCAGRGEIIISWYEDGPERRGLEFFCHDRGLNTPQLTAALQASSNGTGYKLNFLDLKKLVDEFKVALDPRYGNCVSIIKWME